MDRDAWLWCVSIECMQEYERHEICKGLVETNVLFFKGKAPKWERGNEQNVDFSMLDISQDSKEVW